MIDLKQIRKDFPIIQHKVYGEALAYLDNAATTQKPQIVLDKVDDFYRTINSNIHRGVHFLSERSSAAVEEARERIKDFINAPTATEIIFTKGTTESVNLVAYSFGELINTGDEVIVSEMEHHSNIVPWQIACERKKAKLKVIPMDDDGNLSIDELKALINHKTRIISLAYVSNVLGSVNPVKDIIRIAHQNDIPVMVDAAQAIQHIPIDVQDLDCDFLAFSGHKIYAHTGIGVLYAKTHLLKGMPPYQGGGGMINKVSFKETTYADSPPYLKFEAGTINYPGAVGLAAAMDYLEATGFAEIRNHEHELYQYARTELNKIESLTLYGNTESMTGSISFNLDHAHPYDVGMILDKMGIAVRTGHHCAQPLMDHFGIKGTVRASFALYNTTEEVDRLVAGINRARAIL